MNFGFDPMTYAHWEGIVNGVKIHNAFIFYAITYFREL